MVTSASEEGATSIYFVTTVRDGRTHA